MNQGFQKETPSMDVKHEQVSFALLSGLTLGYVTLCGALWHLGYWSTFGFNFLEYSSLSDLFKSTIYPFFSRSWIILSIIVFSFGVSYSATIKMRFDRRRKGLPIEQHFRFDYNKYDSSLVWIDLMIYISATVAGFLVLILGHRMVSITVLLTGILLGLILVRQKFLLNYFNDDVNRTVFVLAIAVYAAFNFIVAKRYATQAMMGFKYKRIYEVKCEDSSIDSLIIGKPCLGTTDKYTFVLISEKNVMAINNGQVKYIVLGEYTDDSKYQNWMKRHLSPK